jgi:hypothetical protein
MTALARQRSCPEDPHPPGAAPSRTRSLKSPAFKTTIAAFAKASCASRSRDRAATAADGQRPCSCRLNSAPKSPPSKTGMGEEAATPGQPAALSRSSEVVPRRFTLENHRLPLALPQSFGKLRTSRFRWYPLSITLSRAATQNSRWFVQKLWTLRLPCGSMRKKQSELWIIRCLSNNFNHLHAVQTILNIRRVSALLRLE